MNQRSQEWSMLHSHYQNVKSKHNLGSSDLFKQLNRPNDVSYYHYSAFLDYLSPSGINRTPADKPGTVGRATRDILKYNLSKTDWLPSNMSYSEKLYEMAAVPHGISVRVVNDNPTHPEIEVDIILDVSPLLSRQVLERMFTIDGIIPKVVEIRECRYL